MSTNSGRESQGSRPLFLRGRGFRAAFLIVGLVVVAALIFTSVVWSRVDTFDLLPPGGDNDDAQSQTLGTTYLVVGTDVGIERHPTEVQYDAPGEERARADVLFLVNVVEGEATVVPVPRDLLAPREQGAPIRLALHLLDGPQQVVNGVCGALGVAVERYVSVDAPGFIDGVDALGGVEVDLPYDIRDWRAKLELPAGSHTLDGGDTLALVRSRTPEFLTEDGWVDDDVDMPLRMEWSTHVLGQLKSNAASPWKALKAAWATSDGLTIGGGIHVGELRELASASITTVELPFDEQGSGEVLAVQTTDQTQQVLDEAGFDTSCTYPADSGGGNLPGQGGLNG